MALVSVILPVYNAQKTIGGAIGSVLNQTYPDFELIVINDGSSDSTLQEVEKIRDGRVRVFSFENAGLPISRNRGMNLAKGDYISFIDADDLWTHDKLEAQIEALKNHPEAGVAYSWTAFIDEKGRYLHAMEPIYLEGDVYKEILQYCFVTSGSNVLIRRKYLESVGLFEPDLKSAADWDYWIRLSRNCNFALVPHYQILYRVWSGAMSYDTRSTEENTFKVIDKAFFDAPLKFQFLRNRALSMANRYFTSLYLTRNTVPNWRRLAIQKLKFSIYYYPWILFSRNTQFHFWTLVLLCVFPDKISSNLVRLLLKLKGRLMMLTISELREKPLTCAIGHNLSKQN